MNLSKINDLRFWVRWQVAGALFKNLDPNDVEIMDTAWNEDREPVPVWVNLQNAFNYLKISIREAKVKASHDSNLHVVCGTTKLIIDSTAWRYHPKPPHQSRSYNPVSAIEIVY